MNKSINKLIDLFDKGDRIDTMQIINLEDVSERFSIAYQDTHKDKTRIPELLSITHLLERLPYDEDVYLNEIIKLIILEQIGLSIKWAWPISKDLTNLEALKEFIAFHEKNNTINTNEYKELYCKHIKEELNDDDF